MSLKHSMFPPRSRQWPKGCWPSDCQILLLQACLVEDDEAALSAFHGWRELVPLDAVDGTSARLLFRLYHRLRRVGCLLPDMARLAGIARHQWVRTQFVRRECAGVLGLAEKAGIDTMLLKGVALNATVGADAPRSMSDIDVVVRRHDVPRFIALLEASGWATIHDFSERLVEVTHAIAMRAKDGNEIDLHWGIFQDRFLSDEQIEDFWQSSLTIIFDGHQTRILCPADQLSHTCEHGMRYNDVPPFRWLADAHAIVSHGAANIDWDRCERLAREHDLVPPLAETLQFLRQKLGLNLPAGATGLLVRRASLRACMAHRLRTRRQPGVHPFIQTFPNNLVAYMRMRRLKHGIGLGTYHCMVNYVAMTPANAIVHFLRLSILAALATWLDAVNSAGARIRGRDVRWISTLSLGPEHLAGAYAPELSDGQVFRWTKPTASILCSLKRSDYRVTLNLLPAREWLSGSIRIMVNEQTIILESARPDAIRFRIPQGAFIDHQEQRIVLKCEPWNAATRDPRHLGFPLVNIEVDEIA